MQVVEEKAVIEIPVENAVSVNPYDRMIEIALGSDVGLDKLERLLELKERHESHEAEKDHFFAMAEFKKESAQIIKDKQGHNSSYATLANILDVVTPSLGGFGLSLTWALEQSAKEVKVTAVLTHANGCIKRTSLTFGLDTSGNKSDIHGLGSTISYLERYTAKAILGVAEKDQDNDAKNIGKPKVNNLVKITAEYKALQETKKLFPEEYELMIIECKGEPTTAPDCKFADEWIKTFVDNKNKD